MFSSFIESYRNLYLNIKLQLISVEDAVSAIPIGTYPAGTIFAGVVINYMTGEVEFYLPKVSERNFCCYRAKGLFSLQLDENKIQSEPADGISFYDLTNRDG